MFHTPNITAAPSTLDKLDALIAKLTAARGAATTGRFFDSSAGHAAINAAHDLFEVDGLYDLALDVADTIAVEPRHCDPYFSGMSLAPVSVSAGRLTVSA